MDDIRTQAYYHGQIDRKQAENLLVKDGQFLIRSRGTIVEQLVLSCKQDGKHLHFIIYETNTDPKKFLFENETFNTVSELIDYHRNNQVPITKEFGALINEPVNVSITNGLIFSSEYLQKLYLKISAIWMEDWNDLTINNNITDLIVESNAEILARHLSECNLKFFGLTRNINNKLSINSGLELMLLPEGTQFRYVNQ